MHSKLVHFNLITPHWRPVKRVCVFPPRCSLFFHITMWYRMKLAQVSVCDINLELLFGCHHWPCHHFVTCFLDFVNWSWVSELAFIPVECACSVSMLASPLTPHPRLSLPMVLVTCIPWICEINVNPSHGADEEDSENIKRRKHASSYLIVRLILWNKIGIRPFTHSFLSQPILWLSFSILIFFPFKKNVYQTPELCLSASFYTL